MKKIICILCIVLIVASTTMCGLVSAFADTYEEECDLVFRNALEEILDAEDIEATSIKVTKNLLYDMQLFDMGYVYEMEYEGVLGYAIVVNTTGIFDVAEFYTEAVNPYADCEGNRVYVGLFTYLEFKDEAFFDASTGVVIDEVTLAALQNNSLYSALLGSSMGLEVIYYISRTELASFALVKRHPAYTPVSINNACVPAAGGNIIGYYDRYFDNLIPNFTPGSVTLGYYLYKEDATEAGQLITTLANYMGTNGAQLGTTVAGFKTGMTRYVTEKSLSISYTSCMQSGSLSYTLAKSKLDSGLPLAIFVRSYYIVSLTNETSSESLNYITNNVAHAMAGFGYKTITYTLTSGATRTDNYIQVATGMLDQVKGYFNISYNTTIDDCYAVSIY